MKKANVNLFDKNKVQMKLLKNKNLRIADGRKHPTKIVNLKKTGITIWTDGKHLKIFRGNRLTEVIGRSVYRVNKLETVEFVAGNVSEKRKVGGKTTTNFVGATNISEGLVAGTKATNFVGATNISEGLVAGTKATNFVGATNISEGLVAGTKAANFVGATNISEGLVAGTKAANFVGATNISEGRHIMSEDVLIIGAKDTSEARSLKKGYAIYINIHGKFATVRQGNI